MIEQGEQVIVRCTVHEETGGARTVTLLLVSCLSVEILTGLSSFPVHSISSFSPLNGGQNELSNHLSYQIGTICEYSILQRNYHSILKFF